MKALLLRDLRREDEALDVGEAQAHLEGAGRLLLHLDLHHDVLAVGIEADDLAGPSVDHVRRHHDGVRGAV